MVLSMPQTKHMRKLNCFYMRTPPCAACIIASTLGLGKPLPFESCWTPRWELTASCLVVNKRAPWYGGMIVVGSRLSQVLHPAAEEIGFGGGGQWVRARSAAVTMSRKLVR
jgi:hypothetical protein